MRRFGDRLRGRRFIQDGDSYEEGEDVDLDIPPMRPEPPVEVQGEPWGWTKPGARPRGWRADGIYDQRQPGDSAERDGQERLWR